MNVQTVEELQADMFYLNEENQKLIAFVTNVLIKNIDGPYVRCSRLVETLGKLNELRSFISYEFLYDVEDQNKIQTVIEVGTQK